MDDSIAIVLLSILKLAPDVAFLLDESSSSSLSPFTSKHSIEGVSGYEGKAFGHYITPHVCRLRLVLDYSTLGQSMYD